MGMRMRPMGAFEVEDATEQVTCCSCRERFAVGRNVARTNCPKCGSMVALHRLRMPAMPTGKEKKQEGVIRLRAVTGAGETRSGSKQDRGAYSNRVPMLENGEPSSILEAGERDRQAAARLPFAARVKIEERRRELFEEPGEAEPVAVAMARPTPWAVLAISLVVFVVLTLVAVILALRDDGPPREKPAAHAE